MLMRKLLKRLDNSITGDIIGVVCMTIMFIALPWIGFSMMP